ncbi:hypothetical protein EJB05_00579 [Eragrostis curvula]|uniref:Uncharacterized protein n=1 Tax=Eragrostis curvula TaxID=38414 RepID=A0A5J9WMV6_9POAL|nr:hypothetical protein EJB05_00579 [Eragrostis curvula]
MAPTASEVLLGAATDGNIRLLKKMARKVNLREATGFKGRNALHRAAAAGETPMLLAVEYEEGNGNVHVLRYLLDRGAVPARPDARGYTPLHNAAEFGHCEAAKLLLSKGVPLDPINHRGTPLHLAAANGHDQVVKILLEHGADAGADVNAKCPTGQPVLMSAIDEGLTDIAIFLLETGADPNIDDGDGRFPIMAAADHEQRELVEILFPMTKQIQSLPDWSVDGIIRTMKYKPSEHQEEECATYWKMRGNKQFLKGDYVAAVHMYSMAITKDPLDATLFANRSLCWLRKREGELARIDAQHC